MNENEYNPRNKDGTFNSIFDSIKKNIALKKKIWLYCDDQNESWILFKYLFLKIFGKDFDSLINSKKLNRFNYFLDEIKERKYFILSREQDKNKYKTSWELKKSKYKGFYIEYTEEVKLKKVPVGYAGFVGKRIFSGTFKSKWKKMKKIAKEKNDIKKN